MKRKILSLILVFSLMLATSAIVFAEGTNANSAENGFGGVTVETVHLEKDASKMRILAVSDVHYSSGTNPAVNNPYITLKDVYGIDREEKMQKFVDGILRENFIEEVDCVIIAGDLGYNDKPFQYFTKQYRSQIGKTDYSTWTDDDWWYWHDYMMENFYASEYDTIYQLKVKYLDQLTEAGIPYYVTPGNHDPYTLEMWERTFGSPAYDASGSLVQDAHIYFTYNEDGSVFSTDYMLRFPEYDTAIAMLDTYAWEEDPVTHRPVDRCIAYLKNDNLYYTPVENDETRKTNFLEMVEEAKDYQHFYIASHYYDAPTYDKASTADRNFLANNGNKYGNLRMMIYGHNHESSRSKVETENGTVQLSSAAHWSHQGYTGSQYNKDTGEKEKIWYPVSPCPWGYNCIESSTDKVTLYRIHIDVTYEVDEAIKNHVINNIDKTGTARLDQFCVPNGEPYSVEYIRKDFLTVFTRTER